MRGLAAALALVVIALPAAGAQDPVPARTSRGGVEEPTLATVLTRAGAYLADYYQKLAGIVAEEHYRQNVTNTSPRSGRVSRQFRELRSDLLLVKAGEANLWLQFRDVFEVDRKPIRDRDDRLHKLFLSAAPDARAQAERIQLESARYNIGPLMRTINIPTLALLFFDAELQSRLEFKRKDAGNVRQFANLAEQGAVWLIEYRETEPDTLVKGAGRRDLPSHGRAWIDSTTGRVLRTELISQDIDVKATIDVVYRPESGLAVLVPGEMRETYSIRRNEVRIDGRAEYTRFRQFTVTTSEKPKP